MTYLRLLDLLSRALRWAMKRCDTDSRLWAELADIDGHIAFRQIDYAMRVQKASGWSPVQVTVGDRSPSQWIIRGPVAPTFAVTTGTNSSVTYRLGI